MYTQYWGLQKKPFDNTPDPEFLYYSSQHEEALARLLYESPPDATPSFPEALGKPGQN